MKRDHDVSRSLLIELESAENSINVQSLTASLENDERTLAYHVLLLKQAGLVEAAIMEDQSSSSQAPAAAVMHRLTHSGHEFLDLTRKSSRWNEVKNFLTAKGIEISLETLKAGAIQLFKEKLGLQ